MSPRNADDSIIKIGVSSCLLGERVRFDSGHKHDRYITDVLGLFFKFVPVCPEVEVGMGVPRESVRLIGNPQHPKMVGGKTGIDWTERVIAFREKRMPQLAKNNLSGYLLKKDSPSCGMERVKIYGSSGQPTKAARGMWGGAVVDYFPLLPVEEEGRLNDPQIRENFIIRVFAYHRLQQLFRNKTFKRKDVVEFHTRHKLLLMAHSPKHYQMLGKLVAAIAKTKTADFIDDYSSQFIAGLKVKTTIKKNVNVLHHIMGYLKEYLDKNEKADILSTIDDFHKGLVPLIVPITLIKHYIKKHDISYIKDQIYLNPHPKELMLRNHV